LQRCGRIYPDSPPRGSAFSCRLPHTFTILGLSGARGLAPSSHTPQVSNTSLNEDDDYPCRSAASSLARDMLRAFTIMVIFPLEEAGASAPSMYTGRSDLDQERVDHEAAQPLQLGHRWDGLYYHRCFYFEVGAREIVLGSRTLGCWDKFGAKAR